MHQRIRSAALAATVLAVGSLANGCSNDDPIVTPPPPPSNQVNFTNTSVTAPLVKNVMTGVNVYGLLSSDDVLPGSPAYVFGGSADGAGLMANADGTYSLVVNNEDNFAVSRITFDETFRPTRGEYLFTSDAAKYRLCSATLATPAEHGFGPLFLTAGESSIESQIYAISPLGGVNAAHTLTAFGHWSAEQALPLPKQAYPGKTVVVIGDDDSGAGGGQLALYVSNSVGDLDYGKVYALARTDGVVRERDMVVGQNYNVTFKEIPNIATMTGAQVNTAVNAFGAIVFGRVEDVDYRKAGTGRDVYFAVTGLNNTGVNADYSRTKYGRVYHLTMDPTDPTKGTLEVVLDGDDRTGPAKLIQNPDNVLVTTNYLYFEEDPNEYGDETHDSYLWQYDLATKALNRVFEIDHRRGAADFAKYNTITGTYLPAASSTMGSWENSGIFDITDVVGKPAFMVAIQAHGWHAPRFKGVDGGVLRAAEDQGSQLLILTGLPR